MLWYLAELLGYVHIDRTLRLVQAGQHLANSKLVQISGILGDYLSTVGQTFIFGLLLYSILSTLSYVFFFRIYKHTYLPKFKGQLFIWHDIKLSLINLFVETFMVAVIRVSYPRISLLYYDISEYGYWYIPISILLHMLYDETLTYWVHRWLHTYPYLYVKLHRHHHKSKDVTPYTGFAFHPFDAFAQALPTFTSCFIFPIHVNIQLAFSLMTTVWAISIHDNVPALPIKLFLYSTHHTIHHEPGDGGMKNIGKFTSVWDRIMGTYEEPDRINYGWKQQPIGLNKWSWFNNKLNDLLPSKVKQQ